MRSQQRGCIAWTTLPTGERRMAVPGVQHPRNPSRGEAFALEGRDLHLGTTFTFA